MALSAEQSQSLRSELDALRQEYAAKIGARDAEHIRTVRAVARISRVAGRLLIHFSLEPVSWAAGVIALGTYKVLENMEIGHNVLHGQYDFMRDPELSSATYEWDMVGTAKSWKRAHNATHHVFTNVIGRDRDFGYNAFRFSEDVPWKPIHLLQPLREPAQRIVLRVLDRRLRSRSLRRARAEVERIGRRASGVLVARWPAICGPSRARPHGRGSSSTSSSRRSRVRSR